MANKYSKWNLAETYQKKNKEVVDVFKNQETCFFQNKATHIYLMDTYVYPCHSALDNVDFEIMARIVASRVIAIEQLYCYLYIQGLDITMPELIQRLQILHSKSMIRKGMVINGRRKRFINHIYLENMDFFEPTKMGRDFLHNMAFKGLNMRMHSKEWTCITWYEYVRSSIMWNQIILKLLLHSNHINHFNMQFLIRGNKHKRVYVPLLISTRQKTYVFEFVRGLAKGKIFMEEKWKKWKNCPEVYGEKVHLVFLCENEYHMETMVMHLNNLIDESEISIYFTHDDLWFGENRERFKKYCLDERKLKTYTFI